MQVFHLIKPNWIEIKELRDMVFQTYPDPPVPKSYFKVKAFFKKILLQNFVNFCKNSFAHCFKATKLRQYGQTIANSFQNNYLKVKCTEIWRNINPT